MKEYIYILIAFFLFSCTYDKIYENRESDKQEAQKVINKFYFFIQENNDKAALTLFSNRFYKIISKQDFEEILNKADKDYGKVKDYELVNSWTQITKGSNPISKYELSYNVIRDSINTKEYFKMQKENDTIKIIHYRLDHNIMKK